MTDKFVVMLCYYILFSTYKICITVNHVQRLKCREYYALQMVEDFKEPILSSLFVSNYWSLTASRLSVNYIHNDVISSPRPEPHA